jgi:DNA-binding transcriptional ArsR family regulator
MTWDYAEAALILRALSDETRLQALSVVEMAVSGFMRPTST